MFESLSSSFRGLFDTLKKTKQITQKDIDSTIEIIKKALLEGDVALEVVEHFIKELNTQIVGQNVIKGVKPADMIIKITQDELTKLLGEPFINPIFTSGKKKIIMMVGLQGSGKTTTTAKLANLYKSKNPINPHLISLDINRPAAQEQLEILGKSIGVDVLQNVENEKVLDKLKRGLDVSSKNDVIFLDTAGRLQIDADLMNELVDIKNIAKPDEILLVMDSFIGRNSIEVVKEFHNKLCLTGVIITRIDGDGRNGVALNIRQATGVQIKYLGTGEKIDMIEEFHPDRISMRILDMGDIVSLVEKAQDKMDEKEIENFQKRLEKGKFDLNDLLLQMRSMQKLGGISNVMRFLPGAVKIKDYMNDSMNNGDFFNKQIAIILSMTKKERANPSLFDKQPSRKRRVANGSGVKILEVSQLLNRFTQMKTMITRASAMGLDKLQEQMGGMNPDDLMQSMQGAKNMNDITSKFKNLGINLSQNDIAKLLKGK